MKEVQNDAQITGRTFSESSLYLAFGDLWIVGLKVCLRVFQFCEVFRTIEQLDSHSRLPL